MFTDILEYLRTWSWVEKLIGVVLVIATVMVVAQVIRWWYLMP